MMLRYFPCYSSNQVHTLTDIFAFVGGGSPP